MLTYTLQTWYKYSANDAKGHEFGNKQPMGCAAQLAAQIYIVVLVHNKQDIT